MAVTVMEASGRASRGPRLLALNWPALLQASCDAVMPPWLHGVLLQKPRGMAWELVA